MGSSALTVGARIGVVIQARMGSTRLPGKVLTPVNGEPLLGRILNRLASLQTKATVVVATSDLPRDDAIAAFCVAHGAQVFRGSEENVLERYFRCAEHYGFDQVVRLTADNPFTDIEELDRLIALHLEGAADFSHSFASLPIGVGAEIFTFKALRASMQHADKPHHFEHVDEFLIEHPERYRTLQLSTAPAKNHPDVRLTVDTPLDLRRASFIAERTDPHQASTEQAIALCSQFV